MLKAGDRVRISKDSEYYKDGSGSTNPKDVTGTISKVRKEETFCYLVDWDNGRDNSYQINDLYLYQEIKVGDRVRISKDSEYYRDGQESNPKDVTGTVSEEEEDEYCYRVDWDNGESNTYRINDLYLYSEKNNKADEPTVLTVSKEFVLEAHKAACSDWKNKLEKQFPEVFESDKYPTLVDLNPGEKLVTAGLFAKVTDGNGKDKYVPLKGVEIADGIADGDILPIEARYKALYINREATQQLCEQYEVKQKPARTSSSYVVYFEKK